MEGSVICISMACSDSTNNPIHNLFKTSCDWGLQKLLKLDLVPCSPGQGNESNDTWEQPGENKWKKSL